VNDVKLVPPEEVPRVPASVIAPVEDVAGVNPLKDVWKDVTDAGIGVHVGAAPVFAVNT
jgi:hypothetical protein